LKVSLVSITRPEVNGINDADSLIAYCARVSNPSNQFNSATSAGLIKYLIKNKHWSPFEMASMCIEIETSRAIAAQILRHRSFSFQEFSQRYSDVNALEDILEPVELRYKHENNRQSSTDPIDDELLIDRVEKHLIKSSKLYCDLINADIAPETARMVLPLTTKTKIYMNGTLRSWVHYIALRADEHTQKEHRLIAEQIKPIIKARFPSIYEALYNGV
jgi:thymidylate synthase (FAD)